MSEELSNPTKHKIRIPVVVTKSGAIQTGLFWRTGNGVTGSEHNHCYDGFADEDYVSGSAVVHVTAEIDVEALFRDHEVAGKVEVD